MPGLEFTPLGEYTSGEARKVGEDIFGLVAKPNVNEALRARNLRGVVKRHAGSPEQSANHLQALQSSSARQKLQAFVIRSVHTGSTVGMATIQEDLPLYRQRLPLPAKLTRRIGSVLSEKIETAGGNVSAWIDSERDDSRGSYFDQKQAYEFLHSQEPEGWTLVTDAVAEYDTFVTTVLEDAGFDNPFRVHDNAGRARYDELENVWTPAPQSRLFVGQVS